MTPTLRSIVCPVTSPPGPDRPSALAYSLTVPGELRSAAVVRTAVRSALHAHDLNRFAVPALLVATELIATTAQLTPGEDLYLSLRHRDPDAETLCSLRRRRSLWLLAAVVDDWGGEWGVGDAQPPHRGTRSWVTLPR